MIQMMTGKLRKNRLVWLLPLMVLLTVKCLFATDDSLLSRIKVNGTFFCRTPDRVPFMRYIAGETLTAGSILTVRSSVENPAATDSAVLLGSHTITFYPGASIRLLDNGIMPLSGRLAIISTEAAEAINIFAARFSGAMLDGCLLIEITPDDGAYVAMKSAGSAWFKDRERKVFELNNARQLHFPLFGKTLEQNSPGGFWSLPPSSFAALRPRQTSEVTASATAQTIASETLPDIASEAASIIASETESPIASETASVSTLLQPTRENIISVTSEPSGQEISP